MPKLWVQHIRTKEIPLLFEHHHMWQAGEPTPWVLRLGSWPCSSTAIYLFVPASCLGSTVGLALLLQVWLSQLEGARKGEWALPLVPCCIWWASQGRVESSPWGWGWRRAGGLTKAATTQAQNLIYEFTHPNIHTIYNLQRHMKGLVLWIQICHISMTQGNNRISKKSSNEGPVSIF